MIAVRRTCAHCLTVEFDAKHDLHVYCGLKCKKAAWLKKHEAGDQFPAFCCPKCTLRITLEFDPRECKDRWHEFKCACGHCPADPGAK